MEAGGGDEEDGGCVAPWVFVVGGGCFLCFSGVPVIIQNRKIWVASFFLN